MRRIIFNLRFMGFLIISCIAGCGEYSANPSWQLFNQAIDDREDKVEISTEELKAIFDTKRALMEEVVFQCTKQPAIRRIGGDSVSYYGEAPAPENEEMAEAIKSIKDSLIALDASSASCGRRGDYENDPLAVVTLVFSSSGLSVSGSSTRIVYRTEWSMLNSNNDETRLEEYGHIPLDVKGWYIVKTEPR